MGLFGAHKKNEEAIASGKDVFTPDGFYAIGFSGSEADIRKALDIKDKARLDFCAAVEKKYRQSAQKKNAGDTCNSLKDMDDKANFYVLADALVRGAIDAAKEGRFENVRACLAVYPDCTLSPQNPLRLLAEGLDAQALTTFIGALPDKEKDLIVSRLNSSICDNNGSLSAECQALGQKLVDAGIRQPAARPPQIKPPGAG